MLTRIAQHESVTIVCDCISKSNDRIRFMAEYTSIAVITQMASIEIKAPRTSALCQPYVRTRFAEIVSSSQTVNDISTIFDGFRSVILAYLDVRIGEWQQEK